MRKLLIAATLLIAPLSLGQATTPNIQLKIPAYNVAGWQDLLNYDLYELDSLLSASAPLPALSVTGKAQLPGLTTWLTNQNYPSGSVVFYLGLLYTSTQNSNQGNLPTNTAFWTPGLTSGGGIIPATQGLLAGTGVVGISRPAVLGDQFSVEYLGFTATPVFSLTTYTSTLMLSGNVTTFTLGAGSDGQKKCLIFEHDASTTLYTVAPPSNVRGFITHMGSSANSFDQQCYTYLVFNSTWLADSPGVINE